MKPKRGEPIFATAEPLKGYPKPMFGLVDPNVIYSSWGKTYPNTFWGRFRHDYRSFYKETKRGRFIKKVLIAELIIGIIMIVSNAIFRESYHAKYVKRSLGK
jgi:hypothetical protein